MFFEWQSVPWEGALASLFAGSATMLGASAFFISKSNPKSKMLF